MTRREEMFMWAKKNWARRERARVEERHLSLHLSQPAYFSTGYCNCQSDISSAQRPAPLRTRYTKRLNPENNGGIRIVQLRTNTANNNAVVDISLCSRTGAALWWVVLSIRCDAIYCCQSLCHILLRVTWNTRFIRVAYTQGDSDVILYHIYASWFLPPSCR